jgi:hypothetical protein
MKKSEANQIIDLISNFTADRLEVSQGMQSAMNSFIDSYFKTNPAESPRDLQWKFEKQSNNFAKSFQQALRTKFKEMQVDVAANSQPKEQPKEKEFIIKEACEELGMTSQNLNTLIRKYNIPVRHESARKKYINQSTLEKIRTGKYK